MRTSSRARSIGGGVIGVALVLASLVAPSIASASTQTTIWVNNSVPTVAGHGKSCGQPGYSTVQAAVNVAESHAQATIELCPGTYAEQVQVTGRANLTIRAAKPAGATLSLPASPVASTTPCDSALGTGAYQPDQDGFAVCGTHKATVSVYGVTFDEAWPSGTCNDSLYGILVGGGDTLKLYNSAIVAGGAVPINGCQGGIGIQVGMAWTTPVEVGHTVIRNTSISGYQKNGLSVDGKGSTGNLSSDSVHGAGPTTQTAQNGIQISNGAFATMSGLTVTGNECNHPSCGPNTLTSYQATGVLFYNAAKGTTLTHSLLTGNDVGMYYASASPTVPTKSEVSATYTIFRNNRYEDVFFDQGRASIAHDNVHGGNVGIMFVQYQGQNYGDHVAVTTVSVNGTSVAAIQVLSDRASSGDFPGTATFTNCPITGAVLDNASNYTLTFKR